MTNLLIVITRLEEKGLEGEFYFWEKYLAEAQEIAKGAEGLPNVAIFKIDGQRQLMVVRGPAFPKMSEMASVINQLIQNQPQPYQVILTHHDIRDEKIKILADKINNIKCINSHSSNGKSNNDPNLSLARQKYLDIVERSTSIAEMYSKFDDYWHSFFNQTRDEQISVLKKVYAGQTSVQLPASASEAAQSAYASMDLPFNNHDANHLAQFSNFRDALLDTGQ